MQNVRAKVRPSRTARSYVDRINQQLRETVDSIIEIGNILTEAQTTLDRNAWLSFVSYDLPFSRRTAEKLIKIAADKRISNPRYRNRLPPHWTSLHELTFLDDNAFAEGIKERKITPDAERKDIAMLRSPPKKTTGAVLAKPKLAPPAATSTARPAASRILTMPTDVALVTISLPLDKVTATAARALTRALRDLPDSLGVTIVEHAALRHTTLLSDVRRRLRTRYEDMKQSSRDYDVALIEDAFFQLETGNSFPRMPDGSRPKNDIKNPDNPFHGWSAEELFDYCLTGQVCTKYTPADFLDFQCRIDLLALTVLADGNEQSAKDAHSELTKLGATSSEAKFMVDAINAR